jgi:hypothetical protein
VARGQQRAAVGEAIQNKRPQAMKSIIRLTGAVMLLGACLSVAEAQTPIITAQPANETVLAGSTASFSVAVSGTGPFTYQWQFNGANLPYGVITTVAGNWGRGYSGDGGAATNAELNSPQGVAVDASGNLFIADTENNRIRKVGTNGIITTVAGNGYYSVIDIDYTFGIKKRTERLSVFL